MKTLVEKFKSISRIQLVAAILILIGLGLMISKGKGLMDFYREVNYASQHDFAAGNPSPDLLRPWMSIRYISVAYAVPQKYLMDALEIQPKEENSMISLSRLNGQMKLGKLDDGRPGVTKLVADAIMAYRNNPVVTGLVEQKVRDWMTIQYIANSTGIPPETFFQAIGIPMDGNAFKPLGFLSEESNYTGGPSAMIATVQKVVNELAPVSIPVPPPAPDKP